MAESEDRGSQLIDQIWALVGPVVESEGFELIEIEYRREAPGWVLRLYIDQEEGIAVDDCARVSHIVGDVLDVADIIDSHYYLEVSSPGLDRPLRKFEHFQKNLGSIVEIRLLKPIEKRKKFKGRLIDSTPDKITVDCDGQTFDIPLNLLERARLRYFDSLEDK
jgi:ribosome maturation factor RimP